MKSLFTTLFFLIYIVVSAQTNEFDSLLAQGKSEFKKDREQQDFALAIEHLEKAVKLKPRNAEAHYFLGYAYSRLNAKDGKGMINMSIPLTLKSSKELETVNKLSSKYTGEIVVLDPYSKLTAEWGSQAMSYWHNNKPDSCLWAFKEGKKRGGFSEFYLATNRAVLDLCSPNAILISSGDNFTIPLWYLQIVEGYRKDVSVIDISLLNTVWYPKLLTEKEIIAFDVAGKALDELEYCQWTDSAISIGDFKWTVKPSYYDKYLLRGDRVFLSMLKALNFKRDIYFTTAFNEKDRLSLDKYLQTLLVIDKLNIKGGPGMSNEKYKATITKVLALAKKANKNCQEELNFIDNIRLNIFIKIDALIQEKKLKQARTLLELTDEYADEKKYPGQSKNYQEYSAYIRSRLESK